MTCDYCRTLVNPDEAKAWKACVFHPECLIAHKEDLRILKEKSDQEVRDAIARASRSLPSQV